VVDVDFFLWGPSWQFERTAAEACSMNQLLARQIEGTVGRTHDGRCCGLEKQLRMAAATMSAVTATLQTNGPALRPCLTV
jgi:hypothetical protein